MFLLGHVLAASYLGISRSVTFAIAYLMIKKKMNVFEAARQISYHRFSGPNREFLEQLLELNRQLELSLDG